MAVVIDAAPKDHAQLCSLPNSAEFQVALVADPKNFFITPYEPCNGGRPVNP